jgi:hypothetical protein
MLCAARAQVVAPQSLACPNYPTLPSARAFAEAAPARTRDSTKREHLAPGCAGNFEGIGQRFAPWPAYKQKRPRLRLESWDASCWWW